MAEESEEPKLDDDDPSVDDIELAYREALRSIDEAEYQVGSALRELSDDADDEAQGDEEVAFTSIGRQLNTTYPIVLALIISSFVMIFKRDR